MVEKLEKKLGELKKEMAWEAGAWEAEKRR
jgi:hypothetical protein